MRTTRRYLLGVAVLLVAIQASGFVVPSPAECDCGGGAGTVCACCKPGTGETCPMCKRASGAASGCGCRMACGRHHAQLPWLLGLIAVLPAPPNHGVDLVPVGMPAVSSSNAPDLAAAPPSPPPRA